MDTVKDFFVHNPDVPTKLVATTLAICVLTLCVCGSLLTSLVLTFLYTIVYVVILHVVREHRILDSPDTEQICPDSDGGDYYGSDDDKSPFLGVIDRQSFPTNPSHKFVEERHKFVPVNRHDRLQYNLPNLRSTGTSGSSPPVDERMSAFKPPRSYRSAGAGISPASQLLGVNRNSLSRRPLGPAAVNTSVPSGYGQNIMYRKHAKQRARGLPQSGGLGQSQLPLTRGPQTSSPFHDKSQVGLWDTMGMSAIASSDEFISPIGSPARENNLNHSSPYLSSPSPSIGVNQEFQDYQQSTLRQPMHSIRHPVGSKRQMQPNGALSSHWHKWTQRQTAVRVAGRPRLQSPVMVRIAQPDRGPATPDARYLKRLSVQQDSPDSLRKDVILSALRDKRKRGKAGPDENDTASPDQSSIDGGSHLKKRRLNNTSDSEPRMSKSVPPKRTKHPLDTPGPLGTRRPSPPAQEGRGLTGSREEDDERLADTSMDVTAASTSFHRNAIVSSFSSSKILAGRNRKRDLQTDDKEPARDVPPKKVSKSTDVSDLVPERDERTEEQKTKSAAANLNSSQEGEEPRKVTIAPRVRKRAVFMSVHRDKRMKPPSPQQVTAADLHEDRQRALERSQQMIRLLRDESAKPKEPAKDTGSILPPAKASTEVPTTLPSLPAVTPLSVGNATVVDSGASKTPKSGEGLLNFLSKDPLTKKLAKPGSQTNSDSGKSAASVSSTGLFAGLATSISSSPQLFTSVAAPASTQSHLLGLSSLNGATTSATSSSGQITTGITTPSGGLGSLAASSSTISVGGLSAQPSTTSSMTFNFGNSSMGVGVLSSSSSSDAPARTTQATSQPTFQFGSGSSLQQTPKKDQTDMPKSTVAPSTLAFSAPSIPLGTGIGTSQPAIPQSIQPPAYGSSQAPSSTKAPSGGPFNLGGSSGTQPSVKTNMFNFGGSTNPPSATQSSGITSAATGAPTQAFSFGQNMATTTTQPTAPSSLSSLSGGAKTATTTSAAPAGLFSFGASSGPATTSAAPLFQAAIPAQTTQASALASSQFTFGAASSGMAPSGGAMNVKPALSFGGQAGSSTTNNAPSKPAFNFGGQGTSSSTNNTAAAAKPTFNFGGQVTTSSINNTAAAAKPTFNFGGQVTTSSTNNTAAAAAKPAFNFGGQTTMSSSNNTGVAPTFNFGGQATTSASSGFGFGGQQSKPAGQSSLFPAATTQAAQPSGFSFGATAAPAKTLFPSAQTQPQAGPSFGAQSSVTPTFGASASAPALGFGSGSTGTAAPSPFQFGGAATTTPAQQQSAPAFNFSGAAKPSTFAFGTTPSTPQFGQGTPAATPPRATGGFSMGSSAAPRKTASARIRHRARAGRK